ncbi:MAG: glycosyltransferase family 2 protein [Cyanobacteria bacterium J06628_3]
MKEPLLSIIIPTYNRPHLLSRAVNSALNQTREDLEVIVVDDASTESFKLPKHPRLKIIRQQENRGGAAARNLGARLARGRWITYLDDDDELLPHMAQVSLEALSQTNLPQPVALLSGLEEVNEDGRVLQKRIPPTILRGGYFCLEKIKKDKSFHTKQTMVVERKLLLEIGGFDESFSSRVHTELFLRLNPICSLYGLPVVTYRLTKHQGKRVSSNPLLRQRNFHRLLSKHRQTFENQPKMFANFIYDHAIESYKLGQKQAALKSIGWAMRLHPVHTFARMGSPFKRGFLNLIAG